MNDQPDQPDAPDVPDDHLGVFIGCANALALTALFVAIGYGIFHVGRWYQAKYGQDLILNRQR